MTASALFPAQPCSVVPGPSCCVGNQGAMRSFPTLTRGLKRSPKEASLALAPSFQGGNPQLIASLLWACVSTGYRGCVGIWDRKLLTSQAGRVGQGRRSQSLYPLQGHPQQPDSNPRTSLSSRHSPGTFCVGLFRKLPTPSQPHIPL